MSTCAQGVMLGTAGGPVPFTAQYIVVGGGGGGGNPGGGGGAGGYRSSITGEYSGAYSSAESPITLLTKTPYSVIIGAGGSVSGSGTYSQLATVVSQGGGRGGSAPGGQEALQGGSGGGGGGASALPGGGTGGQGTQGGSGVYFDFATAPWYCPWRPTWVECQSFYGGGGGAQSQGASNNGGNYPSGTPGGEGIYTGAFGRYLAGGGGGQSPNGTGTHGSGSGPNTGGGGNSSTQGDSGIVLLRTLITVRTATYDGSYSVYTSGGWRVYELLSSGTLFF